MAHENETLDRTMKAGFKAVLAVLIQIRDRNEKIGEPTNEQTWEAGKIFTSFYGYDEDH